MITPNTRVSAPRDKRSLADEGFERGIFSRSPHVECQERRAAVEVEVLLCFLLLLGAGGRFGPQRSRGFNVPRL